MALASLATWLSPSTFCRACCVMPGHPRRDLEWEVTPAFYGLGAQSLAGPPVKGGGGPGGAQLVAESEPREELVATLAAGGAGPRAVLASCGVSQVTLRDPCYGLSRLPGLGPLLLPPAPPVPAATIFWRATPGAP